MGDTIYSRVIAALDRDTFCPQSPHLLYWMTQSLSGSRLMKRALLAKLSSSCGIGQELGTTEREHVFITIICYERAMKVGLLKTSQYFSV